MHAYRHSENYINYAAGETSEAWQSIAKQSIVIRFTSWRSANANWTALDLEAFASPLCGRDQQGARGHFCCTTRHAQPAQPCAHISQGSFNRWKMMKALNQHEHSPRSKHVFKHTETWTFFELFRTVCVSKCFTQLKQTWSSRPLPQRFKSQGRHVRPLASKHSQTIEIDRYSYRNL